ncbi:zinc ABC transporter substrate-binding protein AztC [uncultured Aureimonas sp.]|uniref:zinc ABC transporter substrate-binding protein AztC n=1 Tax=uncultured Aureimonas sp. TaxID=1604662 RepID=UPI0025D8E94A|nr:zinc ABC transporter substrate-binding protein AztC [uncultured Aureimonas sp.]
MIAHLPTFGLAPLLLSVVLPTTAMAEPLRVVANFSIIGDLAGQVGGEHIELTTLVGSDADAHVYEPRPADAKALARADVVLVNGLSFEGFLPRLVQASGTSAPLVELSEGADILNDPNGGHYHFNGDEAVFYATPNDPHAWQSVANAKVYVRNIAKAFCDADRPNCSFYEAKARAYGEELSALDAQIREAVAAIPTHRRTGVVGHNAFRYFERDYGVTFLSPQGVSTGAEASAADVAALIRNIRDQRATAVFAENISDMRLVKQIGSEAGLEIGGTLYSDALSASGGPASSYADMMRHNARTIAAALTSN